MWYYECWSNIAYFWGKQRSDAELNQQRYKLPIFIQINGTIKKKIELCAVYCMDYCDLIKPHKDFSIAFKAHILVHRDTL